MITLVRLRMPQNKSRLIFLVKLSKGVTMATISDIAEQANVSIATVSRILNYDASLSVTEATKRKVFETAEALNYTKYKTKKHQKRKSSKRTKAAEKNIALFQWRQGDEEFDDLYYMSIRIGAEKAAQQLGYNLIKGDTESDALKSVVGSICIGKFDEQTIKKIVKLSDNAVFIGTNFPLQNFDTINSDYEQAAELAIEHLIQLGHQKIAFIGAEEHDNLHGYREYRTPVVNTYRDIMRHYQLLDEQYFFVDTNARLTVGLGEKLTKQALASWGDNLPTAILAANDAMAIGVMNELAAQQIKVPETISVVGINDLSFARYLNPPLTTVKTFTEEMGEVGMALLQKRIENPSIAQWIVLSTELVVRQSTTKCIR